MPSVTTRSLPRQTSIESDQSVKQTRINAGCFKTLAELISLICHVLRKSKHLKRGFSEMDWCIFYLKFTSKLLTCIIFHAQLELSDSLGIVEYRTRFLPNGATVKNCWTMLFESQGVLVDCCGILGGFQSANCYTGCGCRSMSNIGIIFKCIYIYILITSRWFQIQCTAHYCTVIFYRVFLLFFMS